MPDPTARANALRASLAAGIECTALYDTTVYQAYDLPPDAYRTSAGGRCPRAEDLASRLLLIPCHPLVPMDRVEQAAEIVRHEIERR
jgi:dTDP-4-amino-4,6-dideoxygalactose transaminase